MSKNGLVPIGDALSGMGGPVQALREASPQARYHFTQADQVNQLVGASEATVKPPSCASAWRSWKGCWKDCARPLPDGSRPAKGRTWAHLYLNKLSKELEWTPELPEKHR